MRRILMRVNSLINGNELFVIEKCFLGKLGLWPERAFSKWKIALILFLHVGFNTIPMANSIKNRLERKEYIAVVKGVPRFLMANLLAFLLFTIIHHAREFKALVKTLNENWFEYSSDKYPQWCETRRRAIVIGNKVLFYSLSIVNVSTVMFNYVPVIVTAVVVLITGIDSNPDRSTVLNVDFGFGWEHTPLLHVYKVAIIPLHFSIIQFFFIANSFLLKLINYTATYYNLLYEKIDRVDELLGDRGCDDERMHEEIKDLIRDHVAILAISKLVQNAISDYMLLCYMVLSAIVCLLSFYFSTILNNYITLLLTGRLIASMLLILFLFSLFGSKLMANSGDVSTRIGNISWYNVRSRNVQKYFILMMLRAQRKEGIKAGKFYFITFSSFIEAVNAIISYFSVLKALVSGKP